MNVFVRPMRAVIGGPEPEQDRGSPKSAKEKLHRRYRTTGSDRDSRSAERQSARVVEIFANCQWLSHDYACGGGYAGQF
jgi:hypothetical protein